MALVQSDKLDEALELNQKLFNRVDETVQSWDVISIAPLLPSQSQQEANLEAWRRFFTPDRVARIKTDLSAAAAKNGFKARAFAAYVDRLGEGCPPVALRDLEALGLGPLLEFFVFRHESKYRVATVLPTGADLPTGLMNDLGVRAVSRGGFSRGLASAMGHEMALLILSALLLAGLALVLFLRSFRLAGLALLPAVSGLVGSLIFISLFSKGLNLFHVATAPFGDRIGCGLWHIHGVSQASRQAQGGLGFGIDHHIQFWRIGPGQAPCPVFIGNHGADRGGRGSALRALRLARHYQAKTKFYTGGQTWLNCGCSLKNPAGLIRAMRSRQDRCIVSSLDS